jgi:dihydroneopterin aldolase
MKFRSHIGVFEQEKFLGQNIEVDLIVNLSKEYSGSDKIEDTLSYADFYDQIAQIAQTRRVNLVETLAKEMIEAIKAIGKEEIIWVQVNIRKLAVPIEGIFDHVEIEMRG